MYTFQEYYFVPTPTQYSHVTVHFIGQEMLCENSENTRSVTQKCIYYRSSTLTQLLHV